MKNNKIAAGSSSSEIEDRVAQEFGIHRIPISSKIFGATVNSFFIEKPVPILIDVPPDDTVCLDQLRSGIKRAGCLLEEVQKIIITHPHFDHFGSARNIAEMSGAEVWVFEAGAWFFENFEEETKKEDVFRREFLRECGALDNEIRDVDYFYVESKPYVRNLIPNKLLKEGEVFQLSLHPFTLTAVPGHTPWCVIFHDVDNRVGFVGDFFQALVSGPLVQKVTEAPKSYNSVRSYLRSIKKVSEMNLHTILPGHGELFEDGLKRLQYMSKAMHHRQMAILSILEEPNLTPVDITHKFFPNLIPGRLFNAVSEIVNYLKILNEEKMVFMTDKHPIRFCLGNNIE